MQPAPNDVNRRIHALLEERGVAHETLRHAPTRTSEQAAAVRGEELGTGAKALLVKADDGFVVCVLRSHLRLDSRALRRGLGVRRIRFATPAELQERTGLVPGSVPPFGEPLLPYPLALDASIRERERVSFNAGSLTESIRLTTADYLALVEPAAEFCFGTP